MTYNWKNDWNEITKGLNRQNNRLQLLKKKLELFSNLIDQCNNLINNIYLNGKGVFITKTSKMKFHKIKRALIIIHKEIKNYFYPYINRKIKKENKKVKNNGKNIKG